LNQGLNYQSNNSKKKIDQILSWLKGTANQKLSIKEIWEKQIERNKSILEKISFHKLLSKLNKVEQMIIEEGNEKAINKIKKMNKIPLYYDLCQIFHSINEQELSILIKQMIGSPSMNFNEEKMQNYIEKMKIMKRILSSFDLIFPKKRIRIGESEKEGSYSVPFLFPFNKPDFIILHGRILKNEVKRKNEWKINYYFFFKPSSMWKLLFLRIRNACIGSKEQYTIGF
jgi:hypothetical protein